MMIGPRSAQLGTANASAEAKAPLTPPEKNMLVGDRQLPPRAAQQKRERIE